MNGLFFTWPGQITLAFILELIVGHPESPFHPIRWVGKGIEFLDGRLRRLPLNTVACGIFLVIMLLIVVTGAVCGVLMLADAISPWLGSMLRIALLYSCLSTRCLKDEVRCVLKPLRIGQLTEARYWLSRIVSRETQDLNKSEIYRATIETTAESTVDGVVAVLVYAFLGGPLGAILYKTVSTLDSMVGYRNKRYAEFGWASARLDDILNYFPARLGALLIVLSGLFTGSSPMRTASVVLRDANKQPSPNSGYPEAAFAGVLGVRLGGRSVYDGKLVVKAFLGDDRDVLSEEKVEESLRLMQVTSVLCLLTGILVSFSIAYLSTYI